MTTPAPDAPPVSPARKWAITLTVMVVAFMQILDTSVTNVILPHLQGSLSAAQDALAKAHLSTAQVKTAIASLDDQELSRLAQQARAAEQDVQGGLIVGFLALIGLIVVIIVVLAVVRD